MSNIFRTAEVQRLLSSKEDRIGEASGVFDRICEEYGTEDPPDPDRLISSFLYNVAALIERVEMRCYNQMWDEANDIPQFDSSLEPKDCFHCKRMVKLRGEFCYGHLNQLGLLDPLQEDAAVLSDPDSTEELLDE